MKLTFTSRPATFELLNRGRIAWVGGLSPPPPMSVAAAARSLGRALIASSPAAPAARSAARALGFRGPSPVGASPRAFAGAAVGAPLPQQQAPLDAVDAGRSVSGGLAAGRGGLLFGGVRAPVGAPGPGRGGLAGAGARGMAAAAAEPAAKPRVRSWGPAPKIRPPLPLKVRARGSGSVGFGPVHCDAGTIEMAVQLCSLFGVTAAPDL